jgi:hypothetical protein
MNDDITRGNVNFDAKAAARLRNLIDDDPFKPVDQHHEVAPYVPPPPPKAGGQAMIEATISHVDKATDLVLETLERLETEIVRTREILQTSKLQAHDVLRNHMVILETAMNSANQFAQQFVDATNKLTRNGK